MKYRAFLNIGLSSMALLLVACGGGSLPPGPAKLAGKDVDDFPPAQADLFAGMDGGVELSPEEIQGRNTWMIWTGNNERFWDLMAQRGFGLVDLLKTLDSRKRGSRFSEFGLMNRPGYEQSENTDEFGLYLDHPVDGTNPEEGLVDPDVYGIPSGVIGLRLFRNPAFDAKAKEAWDAERFYNDRTYSTHPDLVRPYRVGFTCAVCHVGPNPLHPPADPEHPDWINLSGTIGNQYFKNGAVFGVNLDESDFLYHLMNAAPPGTVDTSIMATDYNNNPNIINAIFNQAERLRIAQDETVVGDSLLLPPENQAKRPVPHVLVDGADTIGVIGAVARVFINTGTYSEGWLECHSPILGGPKQKPLRIGEALEQSVYWQATVSQMDNLTKYLIRAGQPTPLKDAPGGTALLAQDPPERVNRGRQVFAENCVACHSSKQPDDGVIRSMASFDQWSQDEDYIAWARKAVEEPDFLENNFLSRDERVPVTRLKTNISRALQNNATEGHVWEDFSSVDYKSTPSVGEVMIHDPFNDETFAFDMPAGGPGFYRIPSLVSIWATAPFLHQNGLGSHTHDPSVAGRLKAFDDAIRKLAWPETREGTNTIARTTTRSQLKFAAAFLPVALEGALGFKPPIVLDHPWVAPLTLIILVGLLFAKIRKIERQSRKRLGYVLVTCCLLASLGIGYLNYFLAGRLGDVSLGPIPAGMPVNLLVNHDPHRNDPLAVVTAFSTFLDTIKQIREKDLDDAAAMELVAQQAGPLLQRASTSPDLIQDRGHYFLADLSDEDKEALIAFLKRL